MAYYDGLKAKYATLTGDIASKLSQINDPTGAAGPSQDVPIGTVIGYLALGQKLAALQAYAAANAADTMAHVSAKEFVALVTTPQVSVFQTSIPTVFTAVSAMLNALAADSGSGITTTDANSILALAATTQPVWHQLGLSAPVSPNDLIAAGLETPDSLASDSFTGYAGA